MKFHLLETSMVMEDKIKSFRKLAFSIWSYVTSRAPLARISRCCPFEDVTSCDFLDRGDSLIVSELEGTLLRSRSQFPYFFLVAFEAGFLRAVILLISYPFILLLATSEAKMIQAMTFITFIGLKQSAIESAAVAVLPKFYLEDMHLNAFRVFTACGTRCVITSTPRIMVEHFLKHYLGVDRVIGTEIHVVERGFCTGMVSKPGVLEGRDRAFAVKQYLRDRTPDIALGFRDEDFPYMALAKEAFVVAGGTRAEAVPRDEYPKPLIFHDGRLACRPTPMMALALFLWSFLAVPLAIARACVPLLFSDVRLAVVISSLLGVRLRVRGSPPRRKNCGTVFVCSHRTLLDPVFVSAALSRRVTAVTYSISRVSEALAPIRTIRLTRSRSQDARRMNSVLEGDGRGGDLIVCPEGTTCREPYLLRFSSLFAELSDAIVPVAMEARVQFFYGTTARGWKALDPFYFLMNPRPEYSVEFLEELPRALSCSSGNSAHDVANYIQMKIAEKLGFQCTNLTRRDKYMMLAGNDGVVRQQRSFSNSRRSMKRVRSKISPSPGSH